MMVITTKIKFVIILMTIMMMTMMPHRALPVNLDQLVGADALVAHLDRIPRTGRERQRLSTE
jgi:hypothetical protein